MNDQRLIELEIKISHHELAIEALQQSNYDQEKAIAKLEAKLEKLSERLNAGGEGDLDIGPANEKPPHY